jgi:hypothetical protein
MIQKLPEISIEVVLRPRRECSSVKSSTKVGLLSHGPSGLISEEFALSACSTGLNEHCLFRTRT